ncbi:hypothetical protein G9A89_005687 [Geosiphon pyriformis]|nr:hypothetical protein G9A89_005687 [Geosiphon pyriformis]
MSQDVISEIFKDHQLARTLYQGFKAETDAASRQKIANNIIREVKVHAVAEETVVYPAFEKYLPDGKKIAEESRHEHEEIKNDMAELEGKSVTDSDFEEKLNKAMEELIEHIKVEEEDILPRFKNHAPKEVLNKLREEYLEKKKQIPTKPQPDDPHKLLKEN